MVKNMMGGLRMVKKKGLEFSYGPMVQNTTGNGRMILTMARGSLPTKREDDTKVIFRMARQMGREN